MRRAEQGTRVHTLLVAALVAACSPLSPAVAGDPAVTPADGPSIRARVAAPGARAVLLNVWATWCQPCVEELPDVLEVARAHAEEGLRLVLVSGDFPDQREAAGRFLARLGVDFETFIKQGDDMEFIDALHPGWSGALPATLIYDHEGRLVRFHESKATRAELDAWVAEALAGDAAPGAPSPSPDEGEETR